MVKSIISMIIAAVMIAAGAIYEHEFIRKEFRDFSQAIETVCDKVDAKTAVEDDVYSLQNRWLTVKNELHAFVPHNEIKDFDVLIAKTAMLVNRQMWDEALAELEVVKELAEQIPKTYEISFSNIF